MDEPIPISALNQYSYCPRRCYLIHCEGEFDDNIHTARGSAEHERVDMEADRTHGVERIATALPVWSERIGLIGRCDVVEFRADGSTFPVEHKHGKRRKWVNDDLQLAAQAMCLEEMFRRPVPAGAIYHTSSRRRRDVAVTEELRAEVVKSVAAIRASLSSDRRPSVTVDERRCRECSIREICQPDVARSEAKFTSARERLFRVED
jgi:CRISPR-associated exonuclease Cas4